MNHDTPRLGETSPILTRPPFGNQAGTLRTAQFKPADHDPTAGHDLASGVRDLAAAATAAGLDRPERTSRARRAADAAADLAALAPVLDVYASGEHSRIADTRAAADQNAPGGQAAAERLAQDAALAAIRATMPDTNQVATVPLAVTSPAAWLNGPWTIPAASSGTGNRKTLVPPAQATLPTVSIDPAAGATIAELNVAAAADPLPWHVAAVLAATSRQFLDFTGAGPELDRLAQAAVDAGLEAALLADLATAAPVAATLEAAEIAVGAAGVTPDLIVCHPADRPKIVRTYAAAGIHPDDRPRILPTAGATAGQVLVMATAGVYLSAAPTATLQAVDPGHLGADVAIVRTAQTRTRLTAAVQKVTLA